VVVIEHRLLYETSGPAFAEDHSCRSVRRPSCGTERRDDACPSRRMVHEALEAAGRLAAEGIEAEVIDLRTVAPLDWETVLESLARTNRLVIAHEAAVDFGIGAEIAARAADQGFWSLDAPVIRSARHPVPAPYAPSLERAWLPGADDIVTAVRAASRLENPFPNSVGILSPDCCNEGADNPTLLDKGELREVPHHVFWATTSPTR